MMKGHFSSDRFASSSQYGGGSGSGHYPSSSHQSSLPVSAADAEDDEIQKAIALSKETAKKETDKRETLGEETKPDKKDKQTEKKTTDPKKKSSEKKGDNKGKKEKKASAKAKSGDKKPTDEEGISEDDGEDSPLPSNEDSEWDLSDES